MLLKWSSFPSFCICFRISQCPLPNLSLNNWTPLWSLFYGTTKLIELGRNTYVKLEGKGVWHWHFLSCYWASNIRSMTYWLDDSATPPTLLEMEQEACQPFSLGAILLSPYTTEKSLYNCSVVTVPCAFGNKLNHISRWNQYSMLYLLLEALPLHHLI